MDNKIIDPHADCPGVLRNAVTGECHSLVCSRCNKCTGNGNQGHYWGYCKVTKTVREHHFCCPGDCALEND